MAQVFAGPIVARDLKMQQRQGEERVKTGKERKEKSEKDKRNS